MPLTPKPNFTGLEMGGRTTWYYPYTQGDGPDLRSNTSSTASNQLTFTTVLGSTGCDAQAIGTYHYALDASKSHLTLTPESDTCAARSAAFAGDWSKSACPDPRGWCLGDMSAGSHEAVVFTPFIKATEWRFDYGEMSYSVPAGWTNPEDVPGGYVLHEAAVSDNPAVFAFADVLAHSQAEGCPEEADLTVGSSAADITEWLTNLPSVTTTEPVDVTVGGLSGSMLDVSINPSWTRTCPYSAGVPTAPLFINADPGSDFDWGVGGDGRMRLYVLSLPDDRTLLIDIESTDKATWDAFLPQATPVVESMQFNAPE